MKRLWLGLLLIALTAAILLTSDWNQRVAPKAAMPRVALVQYASQKIFDDGIQGVKEALAEAGFDPGQTIALQQFNSENDAATANTIARQLVSDRYDLLISLSTLSLQTVANANKEGRTRHVFGLVSDPVAAGVGVSPSNPLDHPKHMAGIGTLQPVESVFRAARQMFPALRTVGVAWNSSEANSLATVKIARDVSKQLGIDLLEANVDGSAAVGEACSSLVARGAQALWVGGDLTVLVAIDAAIGAARRGRIPVFSNIPETVKRGSLFDLGANYVQVGREVGKLAADVLHGTDPATIPVRNVVPEKVMVNRVALKGLKDPWKIPDEIAAKASTVIDDQGVHEQGASQSTARPITKTWKLRVIQLNNAAEVEETEHGLREGLLEAKLAEGRDYEIKVANAQADMPTLSTLMDAALSEKADLIVAFSTPTLQVALRKVDRTPVVYTYVSLGVTAGVGRSREDHRANITGVDVIGAHQEMAYLLKAHFPKMRRVGTIYSPAESNMVVQKDLLEQSLTKAGIELISVAANSSTEVADAALALTAKGLDAILQIPGNLTAISIGTILQASVKAKLPLFAFTKPQALAGAAVSLARDYEESGRMAAAMIARIMRGENPKSMPIQQVMGATLYVNRAGARAVNFQIPPALLKSADKVIGE